MNGMGKMYSFYEQYWITHDKDYTSVNYDTVLPFNCVIKSILYKKKNKMWKIFQTYNRI